VAASHPNRQESSSQRPTLILAECHWCRSGSLACYLPSFQMSAASFQSPPTFSQTTTYLPVTSCGDGPLVFRLKVPISRAAEGPSGFTSSVVRARSHVLVGRMNLVEAERFVDHWLDPVRRNGEHLHRADRNALYVGAASQDQPRVEFGRRPAQAVFQPRRIAGQAFFCSRTRASRNSRSAT
jgi:hypothetical protein